MVTTFRPSAVALIGLAMVVSGLAMAIPADHARAATDDGTPQADDWRLETRVLPGEGFTMETVGTVDGKLATVHRGFDVETGEIEISYSLGSTNNPDRSTEAHLEPLGVYVFRDTNGDDRFDLSDEVVDHVRVDPTGTSYVTSVRTSEPFEASRGVLPLEDGGRIMVTATATPQLGVLRGEQLAPSETRLNVTAVDLSAPQDAYVALAMSVDGPDVTDTENGLVRVVGQGAGVDVDWLGPMSARLSSGPSEATVLEDRRAQDGGQATLLLASPDAGPARHEIQTSVVHTSSGIEKVTDAVRGEPGAFLLGLVGTAAIVGEAAWRKLR